MDENDLSVWQASDRFPMTTSDDPMFLRLVTAIEGDQWLEVIYFGGSNPGQTRRIKPLEVFGVKGQYQVYVRAFCATRNEERNFRLDKLTVLTEGRGPKPPRTAVPKPKPASIEDKILDLLAAAPGLKAGQIATRVGVEKRTVNSLLYGKLSGKVLQDTAYKWFLRTGQTQESARQTEPQKDTQLARLCRYYLECLAQDADTGISVFASSHFRSTTYLFMNCHLLTTPRLTFLTTSLLPPCSGR